MCFYDYNEVLFDSKRLKVLTNYIDLNMLKMEARKIYIFFSFSGNLVVQMC